MSGSAKRRPDGKWRARYRDESGREHARHFPKKADAEAWLVAEQAKMQRGEWVDPRAGHVTFREYAEAWRVAQPHRPGTAALYERVLRLHAYPTIGARRLSSVRRSDLQAWTTSLSGTLGAAATQQAHNIVRTIFRAAVDDKVITESPCRRIALPKLSTEKVVPPTMEQVRALVDVAPPHLRAYVILSAATGLRQGEVLGLDLARVDFLRRTVEVVEQLSYTPGQPAVIAPPKTEASRRTVPMPAFAADALAQHIAEQAAHGAPLVMSAREGSKGLVFRSPTGAAILRTTLNGVWRHMLTRAGLPSDFTPHKLRHHYAFVLIDGGESVKVVQERLGHASAVETLKTYSHLWPASDERTRKVVEQAWAVSVESSVTSTLTATR